MEKDAEMMREIINKKGKLGFSISEVAELTGLSKAYLYKLSASGELPVSRFGTRCMIMVDDLISLLHAKRRGYASRIME